MATRFARVVALCQAAALAIVACERPAVHAAAGASTSIPTDTIVTRVVRRVRRASAIQRVTGAINVTRALEPLDSVLVVRVYDQRGVELRGVAVHWKAANVGVGAALHISNASTDSLGLSRAVFAPGATADTQIVAAEVAGVGRIDFEVTVRPTSITLIPDRGVVWSGEESSIGVELKDGAGHVLSGGSLSWGTTDTTVLRLHAGDSAHARARGVLAGRAQVVAWIGDGTIRGTASLAVRPVLQGRFVTLDNGTPPAMRLEVRSDGLRDSVRVENSRFSARFDSPSDTVELRASPLPDSTYHSVALRLFAPRDLQGLDITLVPRWWRIDSGSFVGQTIRIDVAHALRRTSSGAPFWRIAPVSGTGPRTLLGWNPSDLPIRIAFDRTRSSELIVPADSEAFWAAGHQMERDLGMTFVVPGERADTTRGRVMPIEIGTQPTEGHTFVSWGQSGDINDAVLIFRHAATLRDPRIVTHELLHLLGFGHATAWRTVSQAVGGTEPRLTPEDVAYVQLAMRLRAQQRRTGARPGLPLASQ